MTSADHQRLPTRERDLSFLVEATRLLADSLDVETTLATVARLSLPHLGSWCMVDLREGDHMRRLAIIHPDPDKQALAEQLLEGWPPLRDDALGVPSAATRTRGARPPVPTCARAPGSIPPAVKARAARALTDYLLELRQWKVGEGLLRYGGRSAALRSWLSAGVRSSGLHGSCGRVLWAVYSAGQLRSRRTSG